MALQIHAPPSEVIEKIRQAVSTALPCDALEVRGSGELAFTPPCSSVM